MKNTETERFIYFVNDTISSLKAKNRSDFAKKIGVTAQNIYDVFSEKSKVSREILEKCEEVFGLNKGYILLGQENMYMNANEKKQTIPLLNEDSVSIKDLVRAINSLSKLAENNSEAEKNNSEANKIRAQAELERAKAAEVNSLNIKEMIELLKKGATEDYRKAQ